MRRHLLRVFRVAPFITVAAGCGRGGPQAPPPPTVMPPPVVLYNDNRGGIRDSMRLVIHDAATLAEYWERATSAQTSPPPVPDVDFGREMVLIAAMGPATPEEEIHVDSLLVSREVTPQGGREETLTVVVRTVQGCGRFRTEAFPLEIVRARRFVGPIRWAGHRQQIECGTGPKAHEVATSPATGDRGRAVRPEPGER